MRLKCKTSFPVVPRCRLIFPYEVPVSTTIRVFFWTQRSKWKIVLKSKVNYKKWSKEKKFCRLTIGPWTLWENGYLFCWSSYGKRQVCLKSWFLYWEFGVSLSSHVWQVQISYLTGICYITYPRDICLGHFFYFGWWWFPSLFLDVWFFFTWKYDDSNQ